jgi:hypothetical protein
VRPERVSGLLLRLYPPAWRARYGAELEALVLEQAGSRVPWRTGLDVALAALRERVRSAGLARDLPPGERRRGGVLLVLWAWALFVVGGAGVQKASEHWQDLTPPGQRAVAAGGFDALLAFAVVGSLLVLSGIAFVLPALRRFVRGGGLWLVRRPLGTALAATAVLAPALAALVGVAHHLTAWQRNGHDLGYGLLFGAVGLVALVALAAWTATGVAIARRLDLDGRILWVEAVLAGAVTVSMLGMTVATAVWWTALERRAPVAMTPVEAQLAVSGALMAVASLVACAGSVSALRRAG